MLGVVYDYLVYNIYTYVCVLHIQIVISYHKRYLKWIPGLFLLNSHFDLSLRLISSQVLKFHF